jgi:hypothetical protein
MIEMDSNERSKNKSLFVWIFIAMITVAIIILFLYNFKENKGFFIISINTLINILMAIILTYFFTQRKHDQRKQKDIYFNLITELQQLLDKECAYRILSEDRRDIRLNNRALANKINALKECYLSCKYKSELKYIEDQFREYKEFIGNNNSNTEYLKDSEQVLTMYLMNISSKLDSIIVKLYN